MSNKFHSAIVKDVAKQTGKPVNEVNDVINKFLCGLSESLADGDNVIIREFASLKVVTRAARTGRNLHTGEVIVIPEKKVVTFKPAGSILEYGQTDK